MVKIKSFVIRILLLIVDFFAKSNSKIESKTILLIRLDAIGDYVLFRNFIEILKNEYIDYKITLVGNSVWRSIAEEFDSEFVDKFIWIDRNKYDKNIFYRYKKLKEITNQGYELVINPIYSRNFFVNDNIVKIVNAKEKIGNQTDLLHLTKLQKNISDKYYTKLFIPQKGIKFEFYRNKEFFENLLNKKFDIKKSFIKLKYKKLSFELPNNYAILFIGASANFRKWKIEKFVKIGKFLKEKYNYEIVVCGGLTDEIDAKKFKELSTYNYIDLVGKTSLIEFLYVLKNTKLLLSNETSAPHFAVALEVENIFVISNGNHFGKFVPYPKEVYDRYYPIFPDIIENNYNFETLVDKYGNGSDLDINEIDVEKVRNKIDTKVIDDRK